MKIGLIDLDFESMKNVPLYKKFPNIPLMKLSAWHKQQGDSVEWYEPLFSGHMDKVYISKIFSFSNDYPYYIDADEIIKGGSGFCISIKDGNEVYDKSKELDLPYEIEHIYPDYSIYGIRDTAYGFLSRGCPRGCGFCHVKAKEGLLSHKVADLSEFWNGQKNIIICDPNILACKEWKNLLQQLVDSNANIDINQGLDIRLMTEEKAEIIKKIKFKMLHFAWDKYEDKKIILPKFEMFKQITGFDQRKLTVYVLCNYDTTIEQDLERIYLLRDMGYLPYVMLYDKTNITRGSDLLKMQRWVNSRFIFRSCKRFEDYKR